MFLHMSMMPHPRTITMQQRGYIMMLTRRLVKLYVFSMHIIIQLFKSINNIVYKHPYYLTKGRNKI